jgi:hypothetical protein
MKYFETLPKIVVTDKNKNSKILTNLMTRASVVQKLLKNPLIFYDYNIQDSDTPELIAHKYYGDINRFWLVLFGNELIDPQWNWPLSTKVFGDYVASKYTPSQLTEVHHYEKIITKLDKGTDITTVETIVIDEETYNNLIESTNTYTLVTGPVTVTVTKNIVDNFGYEMHLNESKRSIKLINKKYANQIEDEFTKLMGA